MPDPIYKLTNAERYQRLAALYSIYAAVDGADVEYFAQWAAEFADIAAVYAAKESLRCPVG